MVATITTEGSLSCQWYLIFDIQPAVLNPIIMGVPGMNTLFKRRHRWYTNLRLKETKLVIDITDEMYWFTKARLLTGQEKMDRFGMSMVAYGQFFKRFIDRLRQAKITPIIVYNGARLSELKYGPLVAKTKHLEKSTRIRLYKMRKWGPRLLDDQVIPSIACNVLKQIVTELQLEAHQSTYEVYPLLVKLANENDCPVLTSHRDFILANVKRGFLLFEEFDQQQHGRHQLESEIDCPKLYEHKRMLTDLNIQPQNSPALYCLNVLLRPDFCGKYFEVLNRMFQMKYDLRFMQDNTEFIENYRRSKNPWARRVEFILSHWPNELTDVDSVRRMFENKVNEVYKNQKAECDIAMRDYDALLTSFIDANDRDNISTLLPDHLGNIVSVQDALIRRESTAPFLTDCLMGQANIDRLRIEDVSTFRSTYSLADPVKLLLMNKGRLQSLKVFDRQYSHLQWRDLKAMSSLDVQELVHGIEAPPDQMLYDVFLFPNQISSPSNLRAYIRDSRVRGQLMKVALAFRDREPNREGPPGSSLCEQLIVLLRLVVYGFKLGFRENYDLPALKRSDSGSKSKSPNSTKPASPTAVKSIGSLQASRSSQSGSLTEKLRPTEVKYRKIQLKYIEAVYNSFMYYCITRGYLIDRLDQHELLCDTDSGGFFAKVNLAKEEIESNKIDKPSDVTHNNYLEIKHLNEMLNSSIHAYMELNSLYNHPGVVLKPSDYFDCVQIYKICSYLLQTSKSSLLEIEQSDRLYNLISDYLE